MNIGAKLISETFDRIENGFSYPTFYDGIAGACWVLELLIEEKFIELKNDIANQNATKKSYVELVNKERRITLLQLFFKTDQILNIKYN